MIGSFFCRSRQGPHCGPGQNNIDFGELIDLSEQSAANTVRRVRLNINSNHGWANTNAPVDALGAFYDWSYDLVDWYGSGTGPVGGRTVTLTSIVSDGTATVTAVGDVPSERLFFRVGVTQN